MAAKDVVFGGIVGNENAGSGLGFAFDALDDHTVVQRAKVHWISPVMKVTWRARGHPQRFAINGKALLALCLCEC